MCCFHVLLAIRGCALTGNFSLMLQFNHAIEKIKQRILQHKQLSETELQIAISSVEHPTATQAVAAACTAMRRREQAGLVAA